MFRGAGGGPGLAALSSSVLCFVASTLLVFLLSLVLALTVIRCYDVFRHHHQVQCEGEMVCLVKSSKVKSFEKLRLSLVPAPA